MSKTQIYILIFIGLVLIGVIASLALPSYSTEKMSPAASLAASQNESRVAGNYQQADTQNSPIQNSSVVNERAKYLAYEHNIGIELDKDSIASVYDQIIKNCQQDRQNKCTLLQSNLNKGEHPYAHINLRIKPQGVDVIVDAAAAYGEVTSKGVNIDDLQSAIVDGDKRIEMQEQYLLRLKSLEQQSAKDIESLIKIASEMSRVQSDIEYNTGEKARLLQRVQMDIVNISLQGKSYSSFWQPIAKSFGDFGKSFSRAISILITAIAFLLPWFLVLAIFIFIVRTVRRKLKK